MTGPELKAIRHRLGLSAVQLGRAFGYTGADVTASVTIRKYESGGRPIPPWLGRLSTMFDIHGVPSEFLETRNIELNNIRTEIAASTSVVALCSLLNRFERLRKNMLDDGIEADDIEIPMLESKAAIEQIDWSDWTNTSSPITGDDEHILFRNFDGTYMYMDIVDCLPLDENDEPIWPESE